MISGEAKVSQHTMLVQDGQLMCFIPQGEGGSEPLSLDLALRLSYVLKLVLLNLGAGRGA
jgi:hypothetical protein